MRLEVPKEFDGAKNSVANAMTSRSNQHSTSPENVPDALSLTSTELEHLDMAKQEELEQKYFSSFEKKIVYYMRNFGSLANWTNLVDGGAIMYDEEGFPITLTDEPRFDSTGMFWWCPPRRFEDVAMDRFQASKKNYKNHIVLVVFAGEDSSVIGLNNFVMPLRSSNKPFDELRDIVIIGDPRFLALEWMNLMNFPKMHLLKVNGLSRSDLRAANIHISEMCLLLTATSGSHSDQDSVLMDKDPILTSLTIKAMNFGLSEDSLSDAPIIFSTESKKRNGQVPNGALSALVFKQSLVKVSKIGKPIAKEDKRVIPGATVPLLTELIHDSNVQFVEQDDIDRNEFFMSEPFACGNTFATTVLQSLLVTTYFNPFMLSIMRALIFGGITPEFEQILSEGAGLIGGPNLSDRYAFTDRSLMEQISIQDPRFVRHANGKYGTLFLDALRHHSIICLGLYRKIAPNDRGPRSLRRYCITHPSKDLLLQPHDRIFVIGRVLDKHHA
ncbi:Calcium-activated potassium channel slo-1 [Hypsibius exemplaris]|uniref:Calcium-activated potassium channel slo-1 n=1 Tax=Hypsibius exemplaris TaxID=2072580 RepID=A0A1W0X0J2_HYPEX|nr:Calcium-activated potassium channel slo-1 [Hypsibius exemplaris]